MRLSCCAYSYREALQAGKMDLSGFLRTCRQIGFDGVELTAYYFPSTEAEFLTRMKGEATRLGLTIASAAVGNDFAQPDDARRGDHVAMVKAWIDHARGLGAPVLRVFAGPFREGDDHDAAFARVVSCLKECASYAADRHILLALENHGGIAATADDCIRLMEAVDHPMLGLNLDFGNFSGDIYAQFARCAGHAVTCHAKVHAGGAERIPVDYHRVRSILEGAGYNGFVALEYEEPEPPGEGIPRFFATLRDAFPNPSQNKSG